MPSITECQHDPTYDYEWGFSQPKKFEVGYNKDGGLVYMPDPIFVSKEVDGVVYHVQRHPDLFESKTVEMWFEEYSWDKKHGGIESFRNIHPLYRDFARIYENLITQMIEDKRNVK